MSAEQADNQVVDRPHDQLPNGPRRPLAGAFPDYTLRPTTARHRSPPVEHAGSLAASTLARRPGWAHRAPAPRSSIYARAAGVVPGEVHGPVDTESLSRRFRGLEPAVRLPTTSLLLVLLPDNGPPPAGQLRMARDVAQLGARVVVLGPTTSTRSLPHDPREPATVPRRPDDPL
ncbi:MAG: hypothetical protein JWL64_1923, partial [Frankiales bacterium]|nr:hypothetical protein [Frankiales bacterium]